MDAVGCCTLTTPKVLMRKSMFCLHGFGVVGAQHPTVI
ncbi:hypothetical protein MNB_SV-5-238 [hydrothermal vent metagenome]|uniref:Uncharacterized protein n=1 Tax=hydrothermal vent metagenome TaxID=652676 RepID=A0A1W1EEP0_9ZZZZ